MRILAITDIHGAVLNIKKTLEIIKEKKIDYELAILLGDFFFPETTETFYKTLKLLAKKPIMAIPGNTDKPEILEEMEKQGISIHLKKKELNNYEFIGMGGAKAIHTFYPTIIGELQAKKELSRLFENTTSEKTILCAHSPPSSTPLEKTSNGSLLGIKAIREIIEKKQPLLNLCGHVHEAKGSFKIGKTLCLNPGAMLNGYSAIINLETLNITELKV